MPRDASGNYTLPAGNPVAAGTVISTTWANPTMSDLGTEITNSLDRSGRGGMLAPFKNFDGTKIAPGITFTSEPSSGLYRPGVKDVRMSVGAADTTRWVDDTATAAGSQRPFEIWNGTAWVKSGVGDLDGPASSTDNAVPRYDGATGQLLQSSGVIIDDSNNVSGAVNITATNIDATLGANTPAAATVTAFASNGIDDTAPGKRVEIGDVTTKFGTASTAYLLAAKATTQNLSFSGGTGTATGAFQTFNGSSRASNPSDMLWGVDNILKLQYDHSAGDWDFQGLPVSMGTLTVSDDLLLTDANSEVRNTNTSGGSHSVEFSTTTGDVFIRHLRNTDTTGNRFSIWYRGRSTPAVSMQLDHETGILKTLGLTLDGTNVLDAFENKGFYVAALTAATSGTITLNTSFDELGFTLIGDLVQLQGMLAVSSVSSPVGDLRIPLPFTASNEINGRALPVGTVVWSNLLSGVTGTLKIKIEKGSTFANIVEQQSTGFLLDVANHTQAGSQYRIGISYIRS